ncbi:hypothetical protein RCL1_005980 [Eukaryota sp. TZLM3-RCL]
MVILTGQDVQLCRKHVGLGVGKLCERCEGRCILCDSYVHQHTVVRVCDECHLGQAAGRCLICSRMGVADAYFCRQCVLSDKDKDGGCVRVVQTLFKTSSKK